MLDSVKQAVCWMTAGGWNHYQKIKNGENRNPPRCDWSADHLQRSAQIKKDTYQIVTFSLASQMVIDAISELGELSVDNCNDEGIQAIARQIRQKNVTAFMLANQLPLLQISRGSPEIYRKISRQVCTANNGSGKHKRWLNKLAIVAISDPNDLLSYPIPSLFSDRYLDPRLCSKITNVILNIASHIKLAAQLNFDFANPIHAHTRYDKEPRVQDLIVGGAHRPNGAPNDMVGKAPTIEKSSGQKIIGPRACSRDSVS